jgi:hypothetical protein
MEGRKREDRFTATETFERLLAVVKKAVNEFGGGQGVPPTLPRLIRIRLQGVAFLASAA